MLLRSTSFFVLYNMKEICVICMLLIFVSCNTEKKEIREAAYEYSIAAAHYDVKKAGLYCTDETKETTLRVAETLLGLVDSAYIASDYPAKIEITKIKVISDTVATVRYHKTTPIKDFTDTLELRKRDGKWLAHSPIVKNNAAAQ